MPTIEPSGNTKVLVSGANGYIAMWVVRTLLEKGFTVRGAVRSAEKGKRLREYFQPYGDKVEWVVVEDITKDGAYDEAVKDVDAIEHMASPVTPPTGDPDDYIKPAVHGTVGILKSAHKFGNRVKRIVVTSSVAAIQGHMIKGSTVTFDESHWGDEAVEIVKVEGAKAPEMTKYRASKTLAERAAWDFHKQYQTKIQWDLVALNPPFVFGPSLQELKVPADLNLSMDVAYQNLCIDQPDDVLQSTHNYISVQDIAIAHVAALSNKAAGGQRIIISEGATTWQETRNLAASLRPDLYASGVLPRGNPNLPKDLQFIYNNEKGKKIFGFKYKTLEEILIELLADFEERGWLAKKD
ncbi:hypothetical protein M413DRAFT_410925 [Hebeloma cylindrosporum]|uniref:NAD-dependent epimerase/dehydratase domain-containing protein n=1 Tax=Hebeloma cylindrosporum TaxID=76867 RepID=A0A0C2XUI4_HEBCY|nr:hypothetical protein M413DRAFT_410925 [Hebeloma cylindrosporum h7]